MVDGGAPFKRLFGLFFVDDILASIGSIYSFDMLISLSSNVFGIAFVGVIDSELDNSINNTNTFDERFCIDSPFRVSLLFL